MLIKAKQVSLHRSSIRLIISITITEGFIDDKSHIQVRYIVRVDQVSDRFREEWDE
jgi:hypothetical protein